MRETNPQPAPLPQAPHLAKSAGQMWEDNVNQGDRFEHVRFLQDIPLQLTVELGRKRLLIQDLLQLHEGAVIELAKHVGEPFEILVNHKLVAYGEVVVINDKFGVRITDIISLPERTQPSP